MSTNQETVTVDQALQETAGNGIAVREAPQDGLIQVVFGSLALKELHNFKGDKMSVFRKISQACGPSNKKFEDVPPTGIELHEFYVHRIELEDLKTGEISEVTRTVLFDTKGESWAFVSDGIAKDLARIVNAFGMGPYDGEIKVLPKAIRTRHGFLMYTLVAL